MRRNLLLVMVVAANFAFAQDPQFSQYYQAPLYLNPGFTGITNQQRVVANHRIQWPSLPQAFSTYAFSYDIFSPELRSGFGVLVTTDKMGSAAWRTTTASALYSYKIRLTKKLVFSPGLSFGFGSNGLDRTKLRLGDGLEYQNGGQYYSIDEAQYKIDKQSYFDVGSGFVFYSRVFWLGASFLHMNQPNISIMNDVSRLPMKTAIHTGARIPLSPTKGPRAPARISYLTPSVIFRMQGNSFTQLDLGLNYHVDPVSVGIWYRGKPFEKNVVNVISQDALILQMGMFLKKFTLNYSYDFTISEMQTASGGAHEVSLIFEFTARPVSRKVKEKHKLIPCPTFANKPGFWN